MRPCLWLIFIVLNVAGNLAIPAETTLVHIPGGSYKPFYGQKSKEKSKEVRTSVDAFFLDETAVTNSQYLDFVRTHKEWTRSKVKRIFAENGYLKHWSGDLQFDAKLSHVPVVNVSWFAAEAYCESKGKALPTTDQWEYSLNDQGRNSNKIKKQILTWYGQTNSDDSKMSSTANGYGIRDLIGRIWEWTLDYNSFLVGLGGDSKNNVLFCGNATQGAADVSDYASFMRYSFRASLKASFVTKNLGFRCAKETK